MTRPCPSCGAGLQRLAGADGYIVEKCLDGHLGRVVEQRRLHVILACPRCEFVGVTELEEKDQDR